MLAKNPLPGRWFVEDRDLEWEARISGSGVQLHGKEGRVELVPATIMSVLRWVSIRT